MIVKFRLQGLNIAKIFVYRLLKSRILDVSNISNYMCEERLKNLYGYQIFDDLLPFISFSLLFNNYLIWQTMASYSRNYKIYSIKSLK